MEQIFTAFAGTISGSPLLALAASLVWGALSVLLSPCHLASIPLIIGFIAEQKQITTRKAFWLSAAFSLGILLTIALLGVVTSALGRMAGDIGRWGNYLVAVIFFLVGLHLLEIIPLPFSAPGQAINTRGKGYWAAFWLGLIFGIALGPCTFAYMAPVLGVAFKLAATVPVYAAGLLFAYGLGHCAIIVAAGTSTGIVERYLKWNENSPGLRIMKKICGVLVLAGGVYLIYSA